MFCDFWIFCDFFCDFLVGVRIFFELRTSRIWASTGLLGINSADYDNTVTCYMARDVCGAQFSMIKKCE